MKIGPKKQKQGFPLRNPFSREGSQRKSRRLKHIAFLPSFITLMNGACGLIAIIFASNGNFALAAYLVFIAMIADVLDGRVARLTRTTSSFGGQLDSLSDAISFGTAPAFIMFKLVELHWEYTGYQALSLYVPLRRAMVVAAVFYAMCALVRLARFNVENEEDESAHMNFSGLPSPAAAGVVVSLVIFHQQILYKIVGEVLRSFHVLTVIAFPLITIFSGMLMVSRIRYPHAPNQLLRSKKSPAFLLALLPAVLLMLWNIQFALVVGFCGFGFFGVIRWVIVSLFKRSPNAPPKTPAPETSPEQKDGEGL
ncbi:MAG: CDP-diacylglycerol--serine O-phosphatidyltransferase [Treponema sp.]|nr:CDP-diacylglycerol--serine O-phosphatidyltransferase [Treponema sp.]